MTMLHRLSTALPLRTSLATLQAAFLELMPKIETHGQIAFRHLRCPHRKADAIQEMQALGWKWHLRLAQRGKDSREFVTMFVTYLARAVKSGRRLAGQEKTTDVLSPLAQARRGFTVERLPDTRNAPREKVYGEPHGQREQDAYEEALQDNTVTPVPEQAAFRIDFPTWLRTHTDRNRRIARAMMLGDRTGELASKYGISPGRISQLRHELRKDWQRFTGEGAAG